MSETPNPTDVEVSRALNAVVATLNDWGVETADQGELQRIVTGALGGEERIVVSPSAAGARSAQLTDGEGKVLAQVQRRGERWVGARVGSPLSGGYVPSTAGGG